MIHYIQYIALIYISDIFHFVMRFASLSMCIYLLPYDVTYYQYLYIVIYSFFLILGKAQFILSKVKLSFSELHHQTRNGSDDATTL